MRYFVFNTIPVSHRLLGRAVAVPINRREPILVKEGIRMARRLNVPALALSLGVIWGATVLLMTWLNSMTGGIQAPFGWFYPFVKALTFCYPWYGPGFIGGIWGGICGFIDAAIFGALAAYLYNRFALHED